MIDELQVSNIALIREATLVPSAGLTVLTGETGAGKTALLSALKLILGERADSSTVREGETLANVEARLFDGPHDTEGFTVQRSLSAEGRSRVKIDGRIASVRELSERVGVMMDLCGQHEHQRLLAVQTHVEMLDAWAGESVAAPLAAYQEALAAAKDAAAELERIRELGRTTGEKLEEAAFALRRIDEVDPQEGELQELEDALPRAEHGEALVEAASGAHALLAGDEGACDAIGSAVRALQDASRYDARLGGFAESLESALIDVEDLASELRSYADEVEFDPESLEAMHARMSQLQGLLRAFGPRMEDVLARRQEAREVVEAAGDGDEADRRARGEVQRAEALLARCADALDEARAKAAPELARRVSEQMGRLQMGSAELVVTQERLPRAEWGRRGPSHVEFLYRPGAGLTARPLRRIASGGEVSRVMLACKVALGEADGCDTLVFDEVDTGVGGATAVALAGVLADLARSHQVIVVTHLAQVAVLAQRHYLVSKSAGDVPQTSIAQIEGEDRVAEVARMLSGDASELSLAHAREMLMAARG